MPPATAASRTVEGDRPQRRRARSPSLLVAAAMVLAACTAAQRPDGRPGSPPTTAAAAAVAPPTTLAPGLPLPPSGRLRPGRYQWDAARGVRVVFTLPNANWQVQTQDRISFTVELARRRRFTADLSGIDVIVPELVPQPACAPHSRQRYVPAPKDMVAWLRANPCLASTTPLRSVTLAGLHGVQWSTRTDRATLEWGGWHGAEITRQQQLPGEKPQFQFLLLGHVQEIAALDAGSNQVLVIIESPAVAPAGFRQLARAVLDGMRIQPA